MIRTFLTLAFSASSVLLMMPLLVLRFSIARYLKINKLCEKSAKNAIFEK